MPSKRAKEKTNIKPLVVMVKQEDGSYRYSDEISSELSAKKAHEEINVQPVVFVAKKPDGSY